LGGRSSSSGGFVAILQSIFVATIQGALGSLPQALARRVQGNPSGKDATFVYDMTPYYISQSGDAALGTTVEPGEDAPDSSAF
jgi:hypothetical protein